MRGWICHSVIFLFPTIFGGGHYIVTLYFHPWQYLVRGGGGGGGGGGGDISWYYIFTPDNIWWGGDYMTLYFHPWQYLVREWLCCDIIFSLLIILVRGWLYRDIIFSLLIIFGEGVIISWHCIFTPGNIWWGDDYIVTLYFHSWQYLVRGWLYRDKFSLLTIFGEGGGGGLYRDIILSFLTLP